MIIPAIIPKSVNDLKQKLDLLSFTELIQIDVVDGKFVDSISWPYDPAEDVTEVKSLLLHKTFEVDLMTMDAFEAGKKWNQAGASALVFHLESLNDRDDIFNFKQHLHCKIGLSINNDTDLKEIFKYVEVVDYVQLMGIAKIGSQGQPFDIRVLDKIATLRALWPDLTISIDGAVSDENILSLKQSGANQFVVGSNILNAVNPEAQYQKLLKIISA